MISSLELHKKLKAAWEYRKAFVQKEKLEAFRLVHGEGDALPGMNIDFYAGSFLIIFQNAEGVVPQKEFERGLTELEIGAVSKPRFYFCYNFSDDLPSLSLRGGSTGLTRPETKIIREGDLSFEIHLGEGLHTGLFLDQRENRKQVVTFSKNKKVLNLFGYTGAFTLSALQGGAGHVTSVDLSKNYLTWLKRNADLNKFFVSQMSNLARDVFQFLEEAQKKKELFDLIILDPPTFSRGRKKSFSTSKDLAELVSSTARCLAPGGKMFVSVNTQGLSPDQFKDQILQAISPLKLKILQKGNLPQDFRLSPKDQQNPPLKSCWVG